MKKNIITIKGDSNSWYEKVIFIAKKKRKKEIPSDFVVEAESVINEYMLKTSFESANGRKSGYTGSHFSGLDKIDKYLYYSILLCLTLLCILLLTKIF